jgi:Ras GTPase-activating protein-binding protein 1
MGLLSNNNQALPRFMQTFVLAPEGSVANKFYVHNDIFRYQDEVFGGFVTEPQEESKEEVEEPEERRCLKWYLMTLELSMIRLSAMTWKNT